MTQNYSPYPIYYTVTVNGASPTNYNALTGNQAGGVDVGTARKYNQRVWVTGNTAITSNVMSNNETIVINGYNVVFDNNDLLADIISKVQTTSKFTNVTATNQFDVNCLTLTNTVDSMGYPFYVAEGNGTALAKLGIPASTYRAGVSEIGGAFTTFGTGTVITINGVNIAFASSTTIVGVATAINSRQAETGVIAQLSGGKIQLASVYNQAYQLGGANISQLGFTAGNHGGSPVTLALSENKDRANLRYTQIVMELENMATPAYLGSWFSTGNQDGNAAVTTLQFTVGYNSVDWVTTIATSTEPSPGTVLTAEAAVKRSVARALVKTLGSNRNVFDPTLQTYGVQTDRPNAARVTYITAEPWDAIANIATIENNITVTQVAYV